jgi:broad specificity phosphatase PhoE
MKPDRIILLRHAQSEGNVNKKIYTEKPDYALNLTELGKEQSRVAGEKINNVIGYEDTIAYVSPFYRTRQTFEQVKKYIRVVGIREDPRLREQEWCGKLRPEGYDYGVEEERDAFGHFYYRFHGGESCADVYDRMSTFLETLHRDFKKDDYPKNTLIVTHGMTLRVFIMRWFHLTPEEFEYLRNPENAQFFILELNKTENKYQLSKDTQFRRYEKRYCIY